MIPRRLRKLVLERDGYRCQRCGIPVRPGVDDYSLQHRRPRGMGGSRHADTAANLVTVCGSGTTKCHAWIESAERDEARELGWLVRQGADPATQPVRTFHGWAIPTDSGWLPASPPDTDSEEAA